MQNLESFQNFKCFIGYLATLDLSADVRKTANDMYDELEMVEVYFEEKPLKRNKNIPKNIRVKIFGLMDFYWAHADDCINYYSDKQTYEFLKQLKDRANEVIEYLL